MQEERDVQFVQSVSLKRRTENGFTEVKSVDIDNMDDFMVNTKQSMVSKKRKNPFKLEKEMRARKRMRFSKFVKHQQSPVWVEEYEYPQYDSCEPADWWSVYDYDDWDPCGDCHFCGNKFNVDPTGYQELTFEHVNSR